MTELIKIGILYLVFVITAIFATNSHKSIMQKLSNIKNRYLAYMDTIAEDKINNNRTYRLADIGAGL